MEIKKRPGFEDYTYWLCVDALEKDQHTLKRRYFIDLDHYDEILDLIISKGGITYETALNKEFKSCECILTNVRFNISYMYELYKRSGIDYDKEYNSLKTYISRLASKTNNK